MINTVDNGILFVGGAYGNPGGVIPSFPTDTSSHSNVLVGKLDSNRQISWIKVYGGSLDDGAICAVQTPDSGYAVLCGTESSDGNVTGLKGANDMWLIKLDASGNLQWERTYGSSYSDAAVSIAATSDHGFIILGATNGSDGDVPFHYGGYFSLDWVVIKTDSMGNVQWSRDIGGTGSEGQTGSIIAVDEFYYLISSSSSTDHDCTDTSWHAGASTSDDYYVLKLDNVGNVLWDSSYGGSHDDEVYNAIFDQRDNTIVITGATHSNDYMVTGLHTCVDANDMWVVKINMNGTLIWQKTLGSIQDELGKSICFTPGNGYAILGSTHPYTCHDTTIGDIGYIDCWLFVLDSNGNIMTNKVFGGTDLESPNSVIPFQNGFAAAGYSLSSTFTEGGTYGNFGGLDGAFISYVDYWPLNVENICRQDKKSIKVYPNPAKDAFSISGGGKETGQLIILNNIGQLVYKQFIKDQGLNENINCEEWPEGLYFIVFKDEQDNISTARVIKD